MEIQSISKSDSYQTEIRNQNSMVIADEPIDDGGDGQGFEPSELLCAALAGCISITLRMYSKRKEWNPGEILTNIDGKVLKENGETFLQIKVQLQLKGHQLTQEQIGRLIQVAGLCPVSRILKKGENEIQIELVES